MVDIALAAVDVTATVFVMNDGGRFHRRHLLAEARRHLALVLRGRRRDPGLNDQIVAAAISTHCLDISEPKTVRGLESGYRLYTARWSLADLTSDRRRPPTTAPDRQPPADPSAPAAGRPPSLGPGEWDIPRLPLQCERAVLAGAAVREKLARSPPAHFPALRSGACAGTTRGASASIAAPTREPPWRRGRRSSIPISPHTSSASCLCPSRCVKKSSTACSRRIRGCGSSTLRRFAASLL